MAATKGQRKKLKENLRARSWNSRVLAKKRQLRSKLLRERRKLRADVKALQREERAISGSLDVLRGGKDTAAVKRMEKELSKARELIRKKSTRSIDIGDRLQKIKVDLTK